MKALTTIAVGTVLVAALAGCSGTSPQAGSQASSGSAATGSPAPASSGGDASEIVTIKYDVTGAGTSPSVTYTTYSSGQGEVLTDLALPWTKTIATQQGGDGDPGLFTLVAVNSADSISCTISINNKVVDTQTATGAGAAATCKWRSTAAK